MGLDKVILLPSFISPFREPAGVKPEDRLEMVKLAAARYEESLVVDDQEIKRGDVSYTINTLREYNKTHKPQNIHFIMGADSFIKFPQWKDFDELLTLANFVVCQRPGVEANLMGVDLPSGLEQYIAAADRSKVILKSGLEITLVENEPMNVSSTEVRKKIRQGQSVQSLLLPKVHEFIETSKIYQRVSPLVNNYEKFAVLCAEKALDKKALGLKIYDLTGLNTYTDYSIVCSATSTRHAAAIAEGVIQAVKDEIGLKPLIVSGLSVGTNKFKLSNPLMYSAFKS
jgi:nicotinate-nucleotide adenylyltransferase